MAKAGDRELFDEELVLLIMAVATLIMAVGVGYGCTSWSSGGT